MSTSIEITQIVHEIVITPDVIEIKPTTGDISIDILPTAPAVAPIIEVRPEVIDLELNVATHEIVVQGGDTTELVIDPQMPSIQWGTLLGDITNQADLEAALLAKLDKTAEIQNLELVDQLPASTDPDTIYFISS